MKVDKYLIINSRGGIAVRERTPRLGGNEIGLRLVIDIPQKLFERPTLVAEMKIPESAVPKSSITPAITDNVEKLIKEATGLEMRVSIIEQPNDEEK